MFSSFFFNVQDRNSKDRKAEAFYVKYFGDGSGCLCRALIPLSSDETKCLASNSRQELSLKPFNKSSLDPDTIFFIQKV